MRRPDITPLEAGMRLGPRRRPRASIGLTPLIDVVFILLIFFMLASSFLDWRTLRLDAAAAGGGGGMEGALLVGVSSDGLRLGARPATAEEVSARVTDLLAERPALRILLRPAPGTPLQATVDALDLLGGLGAKDVALAAPGGA
ncbi:MAG: biopolymer transporter ExbD [Paracoccaceae bacterium]